MDSIYWILESDGTRNLMALAPTIESALHSGGVLLLDEH